MPRTFTMNDIAILHEDNSVLVVVKPHNIPSQGDSTGDMDLLTLLKSYIKEKYNKPGEVYLGLVHRLDRPTGGVMVFARNSKSAARLSAQIVAGDMSKHYLAGLNNVPTERTAMLEHYLKKNPLTNNVTVETFSTVGAKRAELTYKLIDTYGSKLSLVDIELTTGRSHQIRVQMSAIGCPVYGDARYSASAPRGTNMALWAYHLSFNHPVTKERMVFVAYPPTKEPWTNFDINKVADVFKVTNSIYD